MAEPQSGFFAVPQPGFISLKGAREHNLKNVNAEIPHNQLVVLTGVSGSGKSTLAFDILFAEGQRRYLESLAPYVRQYMKILERPEVDLHNNLSENDIRESLSDLRPEVANYDHRWNEDKTVLEFIPRPANKG